MQVIFALLEEETSLWNGLYPQKSNVSIGSAPPGHDLCKQAVDEIRKAKS